MLSIVVGLHVPVIPFGDIKSKLGTVAPAQKLKLDTKSGVILGITTKVVVVVVAHCPGFGKKVYNRVTVLSRAGDHVPTTPFVDVVGNGDKKSPEQIGASGLKLGVILSGVISTTKTLVVAH